MSDHTPGPCGCRIVTEGHPEWRGRFVIRYCPTHDAAPDLLAVLEEWRSLVPEFPDVPQGLVEDTDAAIAKAKGDG